MSVMWQCTVHLQLVLVGQGYYDPYLMMYGQQQQQQQQQHQQPGVSPHDQQHMSLG